MATLIINEGVSLDALGRSDEAIAVCDYLLVRFATAIADEE